MDTFSAMGLAILAISAGLIVGIFLAWTDKKRRKPGTPVYDMNRLRDHIEHCPRCQGHR